MNPTVVKVQGTLRADGTLLLDEKPNLPPGPVKVRVEAVPETPVPTDDVSAVLQRIHAEQKARGYKSPSKEEIDAEIEAMRQ